MCIFSHTWSLEVSFEGLKAELFRKGQEISRSEWGDMREEG